MRAWEILGHIVIVCSLLLLEGWNRSFAFGNDTPFAFPYDGLMCYVRVMLTCSFALSGYGRCYRRWSDLSSRARLSRS